jgi:hypothetical protein
MISWLPVVLIIGIPTVLAFGSVALVRRSERRLGWHVREDDTPPETPTGPAASSAVTAYLDRMASALVLPAADVAEVRAELADHIADSIASLEAEGLDVERAIRESLARLGSPVELGRQIRAAHQSTRRLLAGAGGGVFAASGGFIVGYLAGFAIAFVALIIGAACFGLLGLFGVKTPDLSTDHGDLINSLMIAGALLLAATHATRYAVRASAGISRRAPRSIAIFWAAAAAIGFGWSAIFAWKGPMSWPGAIVFLCVPVAAFASAFVRIDSPMPRIGRNTLLLGVGSVAVIMLSVGLLGDAGVYTSSAYVTSGTPAFQWGNVPPPAPEAWVPQGSIMGGGMRSDDSGGELYSAVTDQTAPVPMATALTYWHDLRFEAWHSLMDDPTVGYGIDTHYSSPFAVLHAEVHPTWLQAVFHFERMRDARSYEVELTGIGPDGNRYTIANCGGAGEQFNGSVWDWITAPQ